MLVGLERSRMEKVETIYECVVLSPFNGCKYDVTGVIGYCQANGGNLREHSDQIEGPVMGNLINAEVQLC